MVLKTETLRNFSAGLDLLYHTPQLLGQCAEVPEMRTGIMRRIAYIALTLRLTACEAFPYCPGIQF